MFRRVLSAVGAALLVGGLGTMWYAHEQNKALRPADKHAVWSSQADAEFVGVFPTSSIMRSGVGAAAIGAGLLSFTFASRRAAQHDQAR
jgi:hypothetical protein